MVLVLDPTAQVTVLEMPDNTNAAPDFTSKDRFEVGENETAVGTVIATDADTRDYITSYAISGGDDHALFSITRLGALTFDGNGADFHRPVDVGRDNSYLLTVEATSGTGDRVRTATQTITVEVVNVNEPPGKPPAPDTYFSGANAIAAFNAAGGASYTGAKVPVENNGIRGAADSHWRETILDDELMTPRIGGTAHPLSAITIQSLADIGYRVDAAQADAYMVPDLSTRVTTASAGDSVPISYVIITHLGAGPDRPEPIVLKVKPAGN